MRLLIVHLSDIHIRSSVDPVLTHTPQMAAAIGSLDPTCTNYILVVTGDIAFSGKSAEYELAAQFLKDLQLNLRRQVAKCEIEVVVVPGNHDCDFSRDSKARQLIIEAVQGDDRSAIDASVTGVILGVQDPFFEFAADHGSPILTGRQRLYHHRGVMFDSKSILLRCYNTAWMSTLPETANKYFPLELADVTVAHHDLVLSLLHHPVSWFSAAHARDIRAHLETTSDVILTGHEHESAIREVRTVDGERTSYTEGASLQEAREKTSGFNLVLIDFAASQQQRVRAQARDHSSPYVLSTGRQWDRFERAKHLIAAQFPLSDQQKQWLTDVGAPFSHPHKDALHLADIFVDPELEAMTSLVRRRNQPKSASGADLATLEDADGLLIVGPEQSGKTTLAKVLFDRFHRDGRVPVYLLGSAVKTADADAFRKVLETAVHEQYASTDADGYLQVPIERRVVIVDDFDHCRLQRSAKCRLLAILREYFGKIVAFAEEAYMIEELAERGKDEDELFLNFDLWRLKEFGHFLRGVLIERWLRLGRENIADDKELIRQIDETERLINTIRGKNLVPAYPIVLLMLLQTLESNLDLSTVSGSFGQRYEFLITTRLRISNKAIPRDAVLTLSANIAYAAFSERRRYITTDHLRTATEAYAAEYKLGMPYDSVLKTLTDSLIVERNAGSYRFKYPYVYFYFVAKYFARHLNDTKQVLQLRPQIADIVSRLHVSEYANIIIFLAYLTQDGDVIRKVLDHAKSIYASEPACDLDSDVEFLTRTSAKPLDFTIPDGDYREHRREEQQRIDLRDNRDHDDEYESDAEDEKRLLRLNPSIKALQILGQILRNFTGSLAGDLKIEIARECYYLGLRSIQAVFNVISHRMDDLLEFLSAILKGSVKYNDRSDAELRIEAEQFLFYLCQGFSHSFIQKVSFAVGSEHLRQVYAEILDSEAPRKLSVELIDICIRLEHFKSLDAPALVDFHKRLLKNPLAATILKKLIYDHLRLFPVDLETRQFLADKLGFQAHAAQIVSVQTR